MQVKTTYVYYYLVSKYVYFILATKTEQFKILPVYNLGLTDIWTYLL